MELRLRRRNRLKSKAARALRDELTAVFGDVALWSDDAAIETAEAGPHEVILVDGAVHGLRSPAGPFLSVRGLLAYRPSERWVTVDMGAVRFVHNGADVMSPGIVAADPRLKEGEWCWIRDEKNGQPLAVGECILDGINMADASKGKAVRSIHHLGDPLWDLDG